MSGETTRCPNCSKELESSFGPKTCPQCGTLVFVSFDGSVELPSESASPEPFSAAPLELLSSVPPGTPPEDVDLGSSAPEQELNSDFSFEVGQASEEQNNSTESGNAGTASGTAVFEDASAPVPVFSSEASHKQSNSELDSIQAFANSEMSDGHEGELLFDIIIEGLDTESIRKDFRDSLQDRRLQIDVDATMRSIRSGTLRMPSISAIKASVMIHRLKELPIEVRWVQRRLIEDDPGGNGVNVDGTLP